MQKLLVIIIFVSGLFAQDHDPDHVLVKLGQDVKKGEFKTFRTKYLDQS